jgi:hypothetical protein
MVFPIAEGRRYAIDSAQGTPFIDFLGFHCVLKRTVLIVDDLYDLKVISTKDIDLSYESTFISF